MTHVEEIVLKLKDQFSRSMGTAEKNTKKMRKQTSKLDGQVKKLQKSATRAFGAFAAFQLVKGVANLGIEIEQTRIAFTTFIGSAEKANQVIADLQQFANVTPFTNTEVLRSAKSLMAYGIAADDLLPTMDSLGNIAAGIGTDKLPQLITAFGQVKAATRLTGMELRQFTEAGVPLLDLLAKQTGKSVAYIKETMISDGQVSFQMVQKALADMSAEGGQFFNLMEKQSQSLGGRISTLKGKVQLLGMSMGEALLPVLKSVTEKIMLFTEWVTANRDKIASWVPAIAKMIAIVGGIIIAIKAWMVVQTILNFLLTANPIGIIIMAIAALIAIVAIWRDKIKEAIESNSALGVILKILFAPIILIVKAIKWLYGALKKWLTTSKTGQKIIAAFKWQMDLLGRAVSAVGDWFSDLPMKALSAFDVIKQKVKGFVDAIVGAFKVITNPFDEEGRAEGLKQFQEGTAKMTESVGDIYRRAYKERKEKQLADEQAIEDELKRKADAEAAATEAQANTGLGNIVNSTEGAKSGVSGGLSTVASSAPKNVTISIEKLVEELNINTTNLKEGTAEIREEITKALMTAINDSQIQAS